MFVAHEDVNQLLAPAWELRGRRTQMLGAFQAPAKAAMKAQEHASSAGVVASAMDMTTSETCTIDALTAASRSLDERIHALTTARSRLEKSGSDVAALRAKRAKITIMLGDLILELFGKTSTKAKLESAIQTQFKAKAEAESLAALASTQANSLAGALRGACRGQREALNANADELSSALSQLPAPLVAPWASASWDRWATALASDAGKSGAGLRHLLSPQLLIGRLVEVPASLTSRWVEGSAGEWVGAGLTPASYPAFVPFIGQGKTLVFESNDESDEESLAFLQSIVLRIATMLGQHATFTLLDPSGNGRAFPLQRFLRTRAASDDISRDLAEVEADIKRINRELLDADTPLHKLDQRRLSSESFEFIVAANFPRRYDRRAIETLLSIGQTGPWAGRYLILHHNTSEPLPRDVSLEKVKNLHRVAVRSGASSEVGYRFELDPPPSPQRRQAVVDELANQGRSGGRIDFGDFIAIPPHLRWTGSSRHSIATPVGLRGGSDPVVMWFGTKEGQTCAHGMLAAMTGAGKSTLYHVLIMGLALRYSPEELRMYLVDGKFGTEFRPYQRLPHASVVSLNSPAELSRSVLKELHDEMVRRNELFRGHGVEDIGRYRDATGKPLPRLLLLIDEYHQLFDEDRDGVASDLLRRIAQQGRSAGIHMFLGSQRFGAPGMLHQKDIFGNTHLKVAMKMAPDEVQSLSEFGPFGKSVIRACDVAGKFGLNDSGRDEDTVAGRAAMLESSVRDELIEVLREAASDRALTSTTIVFRGDRPPDVSENPAMMRVLRTNPRPSPKELEAIARREQGPREGFGQPTWSAGDRPVGLWLGRELNVHGHVMAMLRRSIAQNLVIVGSHAAPRAGMLLGCLASLAALHGPGQVRVRALHCGSDDEDPSLHSLELGGREYLRACGVDFTLSREPANFVSLLSEAVAEMDRRSASGAKQESALVIVLAEPDRLPALRRLGDVFTRSANATSDSFRRLLADGPPVGIHTIIATPTLRQLGQVLEERRDLPLFSHRASMQVSEDDSFALFRSRKASQLQAPGESVALALYANMETNQGVRFKPYAAPRDLIEDLQQTPAAVSSMA